jgi:hypothetical protein
MHCIEDVLSLNNSKFGDFVDRIYPIELEINDIETLGSVASLLEAILYQGNPDWNHKLWNMVSIERYILHMQPLVEHELLTLPEHLSSPPVFSGVRVTRSFV